MPQKPKLLDDCQKGLNKSKSIYNKPKGEHVVQQSGDQHVVSEVQLPVHLKSHPDSAHPPHLSAHVKSHPLPVHVLGLVES